MATKFDKPYLEKSEYDTIKIGEMFNLASNFDLEGLRRHSLVEKIPFNILNNNNENLIHIIVRTASGTIENKRLKIIEYLVSKGLNPDLPNNQGITPLHLACEKQYSEIIIFLLKCGSDPNSKDNYGRTPTHYLVSGLILEWDNKLNKPLYYGSRKKEIPNLFKSKVDFKNKIYSLIEPSIQKILEQHKSALKSKIESQSDTLLKNFKLEDNLTTSDMGEKLKTKIKEIKDLLENNFYFKYDDLFKLVSDGDEIGIYKKTVEEIILTDIDTNKNELLQSVLQSSKVLEENLKVCGSLSQIDLTYTNKAKKVVKPSEKYLLNKISPFYPGLFKIENTYHFVSNSQTNISYKYYPNLEELKNRVNDDNLFRMLYNWLKQSFRNQNDLIDNPILPRFELDESIISIKNKLEGLGLYLVDTDFNKLETLLLVLLICTFYSPREIDNIMNLGDFVFTGVAARRRQYQHIIQFISKMKDNMAGFYFEIFYYLIEQQIITRPGIIDNKIFDTSLHLVRMIIDKNILLQITTIDDFQAYLSKILQYNLLTDINDSLLDDNIDKKYLLVPGVDKDKTKSLIKNSDNYLDLLTRDAYKNILPDETDIANIFKNPGDKIYYTKTFKWIPPSMSKIFAQHYLINPLDETSLNQSLNVTKIIEANYLGDLFKTIPMTLDVSTLTPEYIQIVPGGDTIENKYLVKDTLYKMLLDNICSLNKIYLNLLNEGKYPLLKIFDEKNNLKFNKYFNRVVPYHFKFLFSLEKITTTLLGPYLYFTKSETNMPKLSMIPIDYTEKVNNINTISKLNYLLIRLTSTDTILEIPNFYYYGIENDKTFLSSTILSYGTTEPSIDVDKTYQPGQFDNIYSQGKINTQKLRINKKDLPDSLQDSEGISLLINLSLIKSLPDYNEEINNLIDNMLKQMKINEDTLDFDAKIDLFSKTIKELINDIYSRYLDLQIISYLEGKETNLRALISPIKQQTELNTDFLKSTDLDFTIRTTPRKVSLFPIIEENKIELPELYFSNDYTSDEFVNKLFEINYNDNALRNLIKYGANPFIVDSTEQSPLHLITTNYLVKPYQTLKEIGLDLRQEDDNGFSFIEKVLNEKRYHNSFISIKDDTSFRTSVNELVNPFYKGLKSKINKSSLSGFNHLRYTKLALELPIYYLLANEDIIDKLPSKIYPSDLVLAKHLLEGSMTKTNTFTKPIGDSILIKHQNFLEIFFNSPGVFIDEYDKVFNNKNFNNLINLNKITSENAIKYFISDKLITNEHVGHIYDILELVTKEVLTTQIIYLLTNMINAHLKIKFPKLENGERARIIEDDILGKIVSRGEINQNLLDIIKNESLPKLLRTTIEFYEDDVDMNDAEEYSVYELTSEIVSVLKLIPVWFDIKDKLLSDVIPTFLNGYLEIYLPEVMRSMRSIVENILKLKINLEKLKKLD
ncbi:hypothetical protein crov319 [Cafeteria roenbergensis virus]|uniref:Ankyrin repeat-containing protein n=1 Tax=Cafeteria roenbergensis virus (strain BV-PW1) TaxID=693272 RepID=E3T590_CROVB|nr:hypothetical protein crov319 [Cafeteria roenbergensis virus BV-PW1]ADO67353.1 hypothetical protein crov319 [Cafeteria roenbergensis virus BV-PW1]